MNSTMLLFWRRALSGTVFLAFFLLLLKTSSVSAQTLAFPGAQGFGAYATGGRNGTIYHVTSLADSGTGTFRDAVSQANRCIVFDVGGTITLASAVSCANNLTIAGQTAPGGGIALIGHEISFSLRSNEIVRFLRIRPGSLASSTEDGINMGDGTNLIFDHISVEFAPYNNIDATGSDTDGNMITIQNSILADPIGQQFNAHTESLNNTFSWCYNILSSAHNRNPLAKVNTIFINNVVYNFQAGYTVADTSGIFSHDIINNYFIAGPSTTSAGDDFFQMDSGQSIYSAGNLLDSSANGTLNGSTTTPGGVTVLSSPWSTLTPNIPTLSTANAYKYDVSLAGALPHDQVDQLVAADVSSLGTSGRMWTSQTSTGLGNNGYGTIDGGVAALNTSGDGIADYWKQAFGLNPNIAYPLTNTADGYTLQEHYFNWLATPHVLTSTNMAVDIDLWQYTGGFTNASPLYSVYNVSNGVASLTSGHIVHFVPTTNFMGMGSFEYGVSANDGTSGTNTVNVLVSPLTQPANLVWQGDGTLNLWANGTGINWLNGTNLVAFASGDNVTFDDTGTNTPAVALSGSIIAGTVYVLAAQNYTFGGSGFLAGGSALFKTGSGQLTLDTTNTFSGGTTINEGVLQIGDGASFNGGLAGNVTNNDTLIYATPGTLTSAVNISGSGTVTESGPGALTLSGTQTYTGLTTAGTGALTISGTLPPSNITNNGSLTLAPTGFQIYGNTISGPGAVTANPSGVLILSGTNLYAGNTTNNSGFLILSNNQAAGFGTVVYNGGYVVAANGVTITNNFSIPSSTSDLNMMATNSGTGTWAGNLVNLGSSASWRPGSDGGTLIFTGTANQGARNFIIPRGAVQFASNAVVSATGTATAFGRDGSANNRSLNLTIRDNANVSIGVCSLGGGKAGGSVTVTVQNNALLSFGANNLDLHNVDRASAITTLRLNGGTTVVGGFAKTQTTYTNFIDFNGGVLQASEANSAFLPILGVQTNLVQAGGAIINDGGFAITIAPPLLHDPALSTIDGGLTKQGTGILTLTNNCTFNGPTFVEAGTLAVRAAGSTSSIGYSTNIYVGAGALLDFSGGANGNWTLTNGQTLWGNGAIKGYLTLGSRATLAPGSNAIGTLTFSNSLALAAGCTNIFKISQSPLANDSILVAGTLTNGGTLILTNIGGTLAAGDSFKLFNATGYTGGFANVTLPALGANLAWNTNGLTTNGVIAIVSTAPPASPVINTFSFLGNTLSFSGTGGVASATYYLLSTTNLATPASNWTRLLTNQFDGSGNFSLTTNTSGNVPQNFYRLLLQ